MVPFPPQAARGCSRGAPGDKRAPVYPDPPATIAGPRTPSDGDPRSAPAPSDSPREFVMTIVRLVVFYLVVGGLVSVVQWGTSPCHGADSPPLAISQRADPANPTIMHAFYLKNVAF